MNGSLCDTCKKESRSCGTATDDKHACLEYVTTSTLNPCPFCGSGQIYLDHILVDYRFRWFYTCRPCGSQGPVSADIADAVMLWHHRRAKP